MPFLLNLLLVLLPLHTEHLGVEKEAIQSDSDPGSVVGSWKSVVLEVCPCTRDTGSL